MLKILEKRSAKLYALLVHALKMYKDETERSSSGRVVQICVQRKNYLVVNPLH